MRSRSLEMSSLSSYPISAILSRNIFFHPAQRVDVIGCSKCNTEMGSIQQSLDFNLPCWVAFAIFFSFWIFYAPNVLGHPDNYIPANPMPTPPHIVPEWYFLPIYAILRQLQWEARL